MKPNRQKLQKKRRRQITLLELMIAMGLMMIILSTLAYFYMQLEEINRESEIEQKRLFKQLYLSTRLADILPKTQSPKNEKNSAYFYTTTSSDPAILSGTTSLVFTYDNGVKLDPQFSNRVLGRLFLDKEHRLCLAVWPSSERWEEGHAPPMKSEVLLDDVESIDYRFYVPPKKDREKVWKQAGMTVKLPEGFPETLEGGWKKEWSAAWEQLPALIEIVLSMKSENGVKSLVLAYPLPNSLLVVIY